MRIKLSTILPKEIKKELQTVIRESADMVYVEAQRNVPEDKGDLKRAMKVHHKGDKLGATIGWRKKGNIRGWRRGGWRSHFAEFGTRGNGKITAQKAQPSLGPAYTKLQRRIMRNINRAVDKALKKAGSYGN